MEAGRNGHQNVDIVTIAAVPVFSWSVGNMMERFFEGLKAGKLVGAECKGCGRVSLPPRMVCERCFTVSDELVELPLTGRLESFTAASVELGADGDLHDVETPVLIGMVKHDGADTCLVARVEGLGPADAAAGSKVKAVLDTDAEDVLGILSHYVTTGREGVEDE